MEIRNAVEDIDGAVFFEGVDEQKIVEHKQSVIDKEAKDMANAKERLRKHVAHVIFNPKPNGNPISTLSEMEDYARGEGLEADDVELALFDML